MLLIPTGSHSSQSRQLDFKLEITKEYWKKKPSACCVFCAITIFLKHFEKDLAWVDKNICHAF